MIKHSVFFKKLSLVELNEKRGNAHIPPLQCASVMPMLNLVELSQLKQLGNFAHFYSYDHHES